MSKRNPYLGWKILAALAGLAALPYLRSVWLPFIPDDDLQVLFARQWGPVSGWPSLMHDGLYRSRATSLIATHLTELAAGFSPLVFHLSSVALHIVNVWLVLLLGAWPVIGWRKAAYAAGFFAVYEGHQEAVIWYAALPELLVFFFGMVSFLCWAMWLESHMARTRWVAASFTAFVLALLSKESGVSAVPLLALAVAVRREKNWKAIGALLPFAVAALADFALIRAAAAGNQHFHDGTFDLGAPFLRTIAISTARLFWIWGVLGVAGLALAGGKGRFRILALGLVWIGVALLPYSFLTYMNRVPSRHTYFASVGLALVVAAGFLAIAGRFRLPRGAAVAAAAVVVLCNSAYVWIWKQAQYVERAAPVEAVIRAARASNGPVYVHCFPVPLVAADMAAMVEARKPPGTVRLWREGPNSGPPPDGILCLDPRSPGPHPSRALRLRIPFDVRGTLVPSDQRTHSLALDSLPQNIQQTQDGRTGGAPLR